MEKNQLTDCNLIINVLDFGDNTHLGVYLKFDFQILSSLPNSLNCKFLVEGFQVHIYPE